MNNEFDIFENGNDYILYQIQNIEQKVPNLADEETKKEVLQLVYQKNKFDYNRELLKKIRNKEFTNDDFLRMSQKKMESTKLNSIKDNKKFDINAVEILYSLPEKSFTLINDEKNDIYLAKVKKFQNQSTDYNSEKYKKYIDKRKSNDKNSLLKSYDLFLNKKYNVILNQQTIERVKNFFK